VSRTLAESARLPKWTDPASDSRQAVQDSASTTAGPILPAGWTDSASKMDRFCQQQFNLVLERVPKPGGPKLPAEWTDSARAVQDEVCKASGPILPEGGPIPPARWTDSATTVQDSVSKALQDKDKGTCQLTSHLRPGSRHPDKPSYPQAFHSPLIDFRAPPYPLSNE
jgi:hypothetical protein